MLYVCIYYCCLYNVFIFFFFFFSSRRRHTRCSRDWSSDVCSSDLDALKGSMEESGAMTPESPRAPILRLGAQLQSIASRRQDERSPDAADAILWETDAHGATTFISSGWAQYTGQPRPEALGEGWAGPVHPEDRGPAREAFLAAVARREPFAIDYRLRRRDGSYRWVMNSGRPRYGAGHEFLGCVGSVLDVHELSQAEEARRESESRLHEFLSTLSHELRNPLAPLHNSLQLLRLAD